MNTKFRSARVLNAFILTYGDCPIFSINRDGRLEIHTAGYREKAEALGFKYVGEGYFCSVWELPEKLLADGLA
jgi:hypothetical protein